VKPERPVRIAVVVAAGSAVVTVAVALAPAVRFAYRLPELHVAIETAAGVIALVAAYLAAGRFQRRRRLDDLALSLALGVLAATNLVFGMSPAVLADGPTAFATWAAVGGRMLGAFGLVAAAFVPALPIASKHLGWTVLAVPLALGASAALASALVRTGLPVGVEPGLTPETSNRPRLVGHPLVPVVQLLAAAIFAAAAGGFARRAERERDEFIAWVAVAAVLAVAARLNYFLYPSLYTEWVYTGDAFRLLFYTTILIAAAREMRAYWQGAARAAVMEERRRIARDLHDGLAQELAFIGRNVRRLDDASPDVQRVARGAARALAESRRAIAALSEPVDRPFDAVLAEAARDVAAREGTQVALTLDPDVSVTPEQGEALIRIASEAITNAARHGRADLVRVELRSDGAVALRVADGGRGFDPGRAAPGCFGLISMRERAEALGARFRVTSAAGQGTEVEIVL
jgi:signal transduction histidine kinase